MDFYEGLAAEYDEIVDAESRQASARRFVAALLERLPIRSALDVACGTGLYARALAERGVAVTAADLSEAMLQRARSASPDDGRIRWIHAPMQEIARHVEGQESFDAVLCMGNSLPHLLDDGELTATLAGFGRLLCPGGMAAAQILNYDRILAEGRRIVGITRAGATEYVRFYDLLPERVRFNVLAIRWRGDEAKHELHETLLRPYRAEELAGAFREAGFAQVNAYGDPALGPFDAGASDSLLAIASKHAPS